MKAEGIYSHFSIYFPLWLEPEARHALAQGLRRQEDPLRRALLQQGLPAAVPGVVEGPAPDARARRPASGWSTTRPSRAWRSSTRTRTSSGRSTPTTIPDPELRIVEAQFGDWLKRKYGSIDAALRAWGGPKIDRDRPAEGRVGFRPLWNMFNEKTARDKDTARFLVESQRGFYQRDVRVPARPGLQGRDHRVELDHRQPAGPRPAGEVHLHRRRLHRPPRLLRLPQPRAKRRSGRSATATPTPTAAPCGSTPRSRASPGRSSTRRWTPATTASPR